MVQTERQTDTQAAAEDATQRFARAMVAGDADTLEGLLASDFTYIHRNGRVEPASELLPSVRGGRKNRGMDFEGITTRAYPGVALVSGIAHMKVGPEDKPIDFDSQFTAVVVNLQGAWRIASYQSTAIPEDIAA